MEPEGLAEAVFKGEDVEQAVVEAESRTRKACADLARRFSDTEGYESSTANAIARAIEALE